MFPFLQGGIEIDSTSGTLNTDSIDIVISIVLIQYDVVNETFERETEELKHHNMIENDPPFKMYQTPWALPLEHLGGHVPRTLKDFLTVSRGVKPKDPGISILSIPVFIVDYECRDKAANLASAEF